MGNKKGYYRPWEMLPWGNTLTYIITHFLPFSTVFIKIMPDFKTSNISIVTLIWRFKFMPLQTFSEGDAIKASETNANNQYLQTLIQNSNTSLNTLIANKESSLNSAISNLSAACVKLTGEETITGNKTFSGTIKVPASNTVGTALQLAARGSRHVKLGDGTIIQWGYESTLGASSITLPTAFSDDNYALGTATLYNSNANVYTASIKTKSSSSFTYYLAASYGTFFWIAIGR